MEMIPGRNDPIDHDSDPARMITMPMALDDAAPVSESPATPQNPMSTPASVSSRGRSRAIMRKTTSHSGTEATSREARPEEMCCSAIATMPLPPVSSRRPTRPAPRNSRRVMRKLPAPRRTTSTVPRMRAAATKRRPPLSIGGMVSMAIMMPR